MADLQSIYSVCAPESFANFFGQYFFLTSDETGFRTISVGAISGPGDYAGRDRRGRLAVIAHGGCGRRGEVRKLCRQHAARDARPDGCVPGFPARWRHPVRGRPRTDPDAVSRLRRPPQPEKAAPWYFAILGKPVCRHTGRRLDTPRGRSWQICAKPAIRRQHTAHRPQQRRAWALALRLSRTAGVAQRGCRGQRPGHRSEKPRRNGTRTHQRKAGDFGQADCDPGILGEAARRLPYFSAGVQRPQRAGHRSGASRSISRLHLRGGASRRNVFGRAFRRRRPRSRPAGIRRHANFDQYADVPLGPDAPKVGCRLQAALLDYRGGGPTRSHLGNGVHHAPGIRTGIGAQHCA